jgi:hypothetical protein
MTFLVLVGSAVGVEVLEQSRVQMELVLLMTAMLFYQCRYQQGGGGATLRRESRARLPQGPNSQLSFIMVLI